MNARQLEEIRSKIDELNLKYKYETTLLRELSHRVSNNLNIIDNLILLEVDEIKNVKVNASYLEGMLADLRCRINSIKIIHDKIRYIENMGFIQFDDFVSELINQIKLAVNKPEIEVVEKIEEVKYDIQTAQCLGFIINETMIDAFKYAYQNGEAGKIVVELKSDDKKNYILKIQDYGNRYTIGEKFNRKGTGTQIVELMVRQLEGNLEYILDGGTTVLLTYTKEIK